MADFATITIKGKQYTIIGTPIDGDVAITNEGVSSIGTGKITIDMLGTAILTQIAPVAKVGVAVVGFCKVG